MADLDVTLGLHADELEAGLRSVRAVAATTGRNIEQSFVMAGDRVTRQLFGISNAAKAAMAGVGAAFYTGTKAIQEYVEKNDMAAAALGRLRDAADNVQTGVGRDLSLLLNDGGVSDVLNWAERQRQNAVNVTANLMRFVGGNSDSAGVNEEQAITRAQKEQEQQGKLIRAQNQMAEERLRTELKIAEATGTTTVRLEKQLALEEYLARREAAKTIIGSGPQYDAMRAEFIAGRTNPIRAQLANETAKQQGESRSALREEAKRVGDIANARLSEKLDLVAKEASLSRQLRLEERLQDAQTLRLKGRDSEADRLEITAQYEQRIADIRNEDFTSPAAADRARARLRGLQAGALSQLGMLPPDRAASIGPGGYSAGIGRVAFGNGLGPGAAGSGPEAQLKKANQILQDISRKLDGRGATFN